jgi:hypothetical protein
MANMILPFAMTMDDVGLGDKAMVCVIVADTTF